MKYPILYSFQATTTIVKADEKGQPMLLIAPSACGPATVCRDVTGSKQLQS